VTGPERSTCANCGRTIVRRRHTSRWVHYVGGAQHCQSPTVATPVSPVPSAEEAPK